jgi:rhodanese-related sulfurtransferase
MRRRAALRATGLAVATGLSGCLGSPPKAANRPGYDTIRTDGIDVPLVPVADAIDWYRDDDALFADARGPGSYERAHVTGAVLSPAPDGVPRDDPVEATPTDRRIVTYCGCPHHLSSLRAAELIQDGYRYTYALDEGFQVWTDRGHPVSGTAVESTPTEYRVEGRVTDGDPVVEPQTAGDGHVWAWHDPTGQREAAPIAADGSFTVHLRFYDVDRHSRIRLVAGERELTRPVRELTDGRVRL